MLPIFKTLPDKILADLYDWITDKCIDKRDELTHLDQKTGAQKKFHPLDHVRQLIVHVAC